jgi:ketosteroid isomerase-like protein
METAMRSLSDIISTYQRAMREKDADLLASLYSEDAVHEFPFFSPRHAEPLNGRAAIRDHYAPAWAATPVEVENVESVAVHWTSDPEVSVVEQKITGHVPATGRELRMGGILVIRVRNGEIVHMRDYIDTLGAMDAMGQLPRA